MLGVIHFGVLAACFDLFVHMAMAGWHLSRNKMLFFSGALFISFAVCVNLTPYFPSVSDIVASVSSAIVYDHRISCINEVNQIVWDVKPKPNSESIRRSNGMKLDYFDKNWDWMKSKKILNCDFQKLDKFDVSELLNRSWIVVAGDSQARFVALSLLNLVLGSDSKAMDSVKDDHFKRHSDRRDATCSSISVSVTINRAETISNNSKKESNVIRKKTAMKKRKERDK